MLHMTRTRAVKSVAALVLVLTATGASVGAVVRPATPTVLAKEATSRPIAQQLEAAALDIDAALTAVDAGDFASARLHYGAYDDAWDVLENGVRDPHPDVYDAIERAMDRVNDALLKTDDPTAAASAVALSDLRQTIDTLAPRIS